MQRQDMVHRRQGRTCCTLRILRAVALPLVLAWIPSAASALETGQSKTVDGLTVYIGAIPAEIVKGHPKEHPEARASSRAVSGSKMQKCTLEC